MRRSRRKVAEIKDDYRGDFWSDWVYHGISGLPPYDPYIEENPVQHAFFTSGGRGDPVPVWRRGWRYGFAPKGGVSWNYREQQPELGVSMAGVDDPRFSDFEWADMGGNKDRPRVTYDGWLLHLKGSDDEPLMVGLQKVGAARD